MHSKARMNSDAHSVRDTLFFLATVFVVVQLFSHLPFSKDQLHSFLHPSHPIETEISSPFGESLDEWDGQYPTSEIARADSFVGDALAEIATMQLDSTAHKVDSLKLGTKSPSSSSSAQSELIQPNPYDRKEIDNFIATNIQLQGQPQAFHALGRFFSLLDNPDRTPAIHVLHFGDSQIEGDRITGALRSHWQEVWGGSGPGYISPLQPVPSTAMRHTWSDHWERKARYGKRDTTIGHKRYGIMAAFAQAKEDAANSGSLEPGPAWLAFQPYPRGFSRNNEFSSIHLSLGQSHGPSTVSCYWNERLVKRVEVDEEQLASFVEFSMDNPKTGESFDEIRLEFTGPVPEINGVGFWSDSGIVVHNLAMRGSSGTLFRDLDREQLRLQLRELRTGLIMLQYGGNAVPYLADSVAAERYGRWFASQISLFQSLVPEAPIIVIGPSDMATKDGLGMTTYPMLVHVRHALKRAAIEAEALYWDVFEVMGGEGSMAQWVKASPPLASADHVHFTNLGARKIAELFQKTIEAEWGLWQNDQAEKSLTSAP